MAKFSFDDRDQNVFTKFTNSMSVKSENEN